MEKVNILLEIIETALWVVAITALYFALRKILVQEMMIKKQQERISDLEACNDVNLYDLQEERKENLFLRWSNGLLDPKKD